MSTLTLWIVVMMGPGETMRPVHHFRPVVWRTEEKCEAELMELLNTKAIVIADPDYHLACVAIPDLSGDPA